MLSGRRCQCFRKGCSLSLCAALLTLHHDDTHPNSSCAVLSLTLPLDTSELSSVHNPYTQTGWRGRVLCPDLFIELRWYDTIVTQRCGVTRWKSSVAVLRKSFSEATRSRTTSGSHAQINVHRARLTSSRRRSRNRSRRQQGVRQHSNSKRRAAVSQNKNFCEAQRCHGVVRSRSMAS